MKSAVIKALGLSLLLFGFGNGLAWAEDNEAMYEVTITNLTRGQTFTPALVVSHRKGLSMFEAGQPASEALAMLAEGGDTAPLEEELFDTGLAFDSATSGGLLPPGGSVTVQVGTKGRYRYISVAAMLIPTNDAFIAVNGVAGPRGGRTKTVTSVAYDAGSEVNDELCVSIPGPFCGGEGFSEADGEGYVHVHAGIHGIGDLNEAEFDWRNPVAKIVIKRIK